jgi:hypothetical protein
MDPDFLSAICRSDIPTDHTLDDTTYAAWVLTHIRFMDEGQGLASNTQAPPKEGLTPWYEHPHQHQDYRVYFGHWAALRGKYHAEGYCNLDGGAVYGGVLLAYNIDTDRYVQQTKDPRDG